MSKKTLDAALVDAQGNVLAQKKVTNNEKGLIKLCDQWANSFGFSKQECLVCLEPTGHYSNAPVLTCLDLEIPVWLVHPNNVLKSTGTTRGKDDKVDALSIAANARRYDDKARLVTGDFRRTLRLKQMITERKNLVKRRASLTGKLKDTARYCNEKDRENCIRRAKAELALLKVHINELDRVIKEVIEADQQLHAQHKLLVSLLGVGDVLSAYLLSATEGFTRYNTARQLACHAGWRPSGTLLAQVSRVRHACRSRHARH